MDVKPMLKVDDLIVHMKSKGIRFDIYSEEDAKQYLDRNNNYFKLSSYRKNYGKYTTGPNEGKYLDLDFAYLVELARIDVEIRHILLKMCLDIEHFLKVALIKAVEERLAPTTEEDGYRVVLEYLTDAGNTSTEERTENIAKRSTSFKSKIRQSKNNPYCGALIKKYKAQMPIWAFVEIISFGDLVNLVSYYSKRTNWIPPTDIISLDRTRQIRNACAHSNCIINDLMYRKDEKTGKPIATNTPAFITKFVKDSGVSRGIRKKKLSNPRINQLVHLLYVYNEVVKSENTYSIRMSELEHLLLVRMKEHASYFEKNDVLCSAHSFFVNIANRLKNRS